MALIESRVDGENHVGYLALNRPEKRNAINGQMEDELFHQLDLFEANENVSCIVLSGNGSCFSAGYDRFRDKEPYSSAVGDWHLFHGRLRRWMQVRDLAIPTVAAVHGHCLGIATLVATLTDIVVIADDAKWGSGPIRGGGGWNGPTVAHLIGHRRAREIEYRNAQFTGQDAVSMGWANYSVPEGDVLRVAADIANDIARTPRESLIGKKGVMNRALDADGFVRSIEDGALVHTILDFSAAMSDMDRMLADRGLKATVDFWTNPIGNRGGGA
jgi:enoyl-CoA hydratase